MIKDSALNKNKKKQWFNEVNNCTIDKFYECLHQESGKGTGESVFGILRTHFSTTYLAQVL